MRMARSTAKIATLALMSGLLVGVAGTAPAQAAEAVAGGQTAAPADSLFPNQGNSGYDVKHYDIAFKIDVGISTTNNVASTTDLSDASTTIEASTTGGPLSSYSFDFQGTTTTLANASLNVDSVTVNGAAANFSRIENTTTGNATTDVHKLIVTPATPVDGEFTTVVKYSGRPVIHTDTDGSLEGWNNTVDGASFVNQPIGSMTLFPNNNTPRDTATYTWTVDAPSTLRTSALAQAGGRAYQAAVVSNGELLSRTPNGDGSRTTWVWDQKKQQASELSFFSIGRYDMYTSNITLASGRTIPEWTFIDPSATAAQQAATLGSRAQLKSVIDFFESKYGPYPGNSTGIVTDNTTGINYALETQDRPFFPNSAGRGTFYHEIMHQWWGNAVAPFDWNDIVLNEGPATYSEYQIPNELIGTAANTTTEQALYNFWNSTATTGGGAATWAVAPAAMTMASQLFGAPTYNKGGMAMEALRTSIGAADFETLMRQYQSTYGNGQIDGRRTAAFQALAEDISDRDLTAFFQTWFYTSGKPAWPVKFNLDLAGPTTQVNAGDAVTYTLSARNTGKVAMPAGGTVVTVNLADVLDDATIGTLPANTSLDGTTLTWTVPATALAATANVAIPVTVKSGTTGQTLKAVARATTLGSTCLGCAPSLTVGTAPITPAPVPTIAGGTPTVGSPLTAETTGWADGTTFAYQWMVDGTPVPDATSATYTPSFTALGLPVSVKVTGTLTGFNPTSAVSAATPVAVRGTPISATPTISGTAKIGEKLTVAPGAWQPGTVFTYQWRANGANISGATGPAYTPAVATQVGQTIDVLVTGTRAGYTTTTNASAATNAVAAGEPLVLTPQPALVGTPKVGAVYQPTIGTWDDGVTLTFQWFANGTTVASGGTSASITPTAAQLGQTLTLRVTGTRPGVTPVVYTTTASPAVETGTQTLQPTPSITGTPRAQTLVNGVQGTWDTGTTKTNKWYADGVEIAGATGTSYTPTIAQIGQVLTYEVTSTRTGYAPVTKTSAGKTVVGLAQTLQPTPTITGTPKVGVELTAVPGTWDDGTTLSYQWLVDGTAVTGATSPTYTPGVEQVGKKVTVTVTSTKADYETASTTSDPTDTVAKGDLVDTPVPTITGTPKVGVELTAVPGTWDDGTELTYQWFTDGDAVEGATGTTYTPGAGKLGAAVTVEVTGTKAGYEDVTKTSAATDAVAKGDQVSTPVPTITGTPKVGVELTAVPGTWDDGTELTYQWFTDGDAVDGATGTTYTPGAGKLGAAVTVEVTGTKAGYEDVTKTSAATDAVAKGDQSDTPVPTITGTPKVGVELTVVPGTWDDGTELTYQWLAGGSAISGATSETFTPGVAQAGAVITVAVTGKRTGYEDVTKTSAATDAVAKGDQSDTPVPTITGTPKVGVELTAVPGTWDDGTELTYQWIVGGEPVVGASTPSYTPTAAQVGKTVQVEVTGTRTGYEDVTKTSVASPAIVAGDLVSTPVPTITGTVQVGRLVTALAGPWDAGTSLRYQWTRNGVAIPGAVAPIYAVQPGDRGAGLRVVVTGTKAGYGSVSKASAAKAVAAGRQSRTPKPRITGTAKAGRTVRVAKASYDQGAKLTYTWLRNGKAIKGAKSRTLRISKRYVGDRISVRVTAKKPGYVTVVKVSSKTKKVKR